MDKKFNISRDQYRELLMMLNEEIYKYAERHGIDLNNKEELIEACKSMKKIDLGKKTTKFLLYGIMHYDVGDQRVLKFIDLKGISFAGECVRRVDFRGTNADVDPQTVEDKNLESANFEGMDMSGKCFDGCLLYSTNLSYTNANIDPQKVYNKDLSSAKFEGLDLSQADFTDVCVVEASFANAKINLDPQAVVDKDLSGTNLTNVDMRGKNFNGCNISNCNLTNTKAVLDLNYLDVNTLWGTKLQCTTLLVGEDFDREQLKRQFVELGNIKFNDYALVRRKIKSTFNKINN